MSKRYDIPSDFHRVENSIKRSRFIASAGHAPDIETARTFIADIKTEFPDATHNCWAYTTGPPGDTAQIGMSDDGEPHGTAGKPMLNVLLHGNVGEIVVVVTRYFGGTKLGTGGLVRAYSSMVQLNLDTLATREKIDTLTVSATIPYPAVTLLKRMLPGFEAEILDENFGMDAVFMLRLPVEHLPAFSTRIADITDGKGVLARI
ncbi:MAG: YigZ family protein [Pseudodesulfovibrio sp.]|nr:YigZ family protein [Pseudodesulfovibrio sp.]